MLSQGIRRFRVVAPQLESVRYAPNSKVASATTRNRTENPIRYSRADGGDE